MMLGSKVIYHGDVQAQFQFELEPFATAPSSVESGEEGARLARTRTASRDAREPSLASTDVFVLYRCALWPEGFLIPKTELA